MTEPDTVEKQSAPPVRQAPPWARLWQLFGRIPKVPEVLRAYFYLAGANLGFLVRAAGPLLVRGSAGIRIGDSVLFMNGQLRTELICQPGAEIAIGARTAFNYGLSLQATRSIRIGVDGAFGSMVRIRDDDGQRVAPVVIGDRVWIAHLAMVEPGVTIGDDAVISAGSVVFSDVPPRMIAIGNPARVMPLGLHRSPKAG